MLSLNTTTFWHIFTLRSKYGSHSLLIIPRHLCWGIYSFHLSVCPFIRTYICSFIRSYFRPVHGITSKFYMRATWVAYISPTTHQKAIHIWYPGGSAFIPWLLTPGSMPRGHWNMKYSSHRPTFRHSDLYLFWGKTLGHTDSESQIIMFMHQIVFSMAKSLEHGI